ncbi:phosphatase PAP2 family protein [Actinokineospora pegani]|uniref:phosphatase PAP2 family protein n=1 Tax=Actinokineospora pegani TaxID=2654637 RepID=UPI0012EAC073|nr:phosphatase PAP2 family protein [Actinokineospora pegani]
MIEFFATAVTDGVILVLGALLLVAWWRARTNDAAAVARALLGPAAVVVAYLVSEVVKVLWRQDRPCRTAPSLIECPEVGDWSFPSNHATVAAAAAVALLWSGWRWGAAGAVLAVVAASSRVLVGVHHVHDVVAGMALGAAVVATVSLLLGGVTTGVARARCRGRAAFVVGRVCDAPTVTLPRVRG